MTSLGSKLTGSQATLVINGHSVTVDDWKMDVVTEQVDVSDMWGPRKYVTGRQEVTITVNGQGWQLPQAMPATPREDIVRHLGTRCCCRHCPEGGDHA